jgi:hypothetical protein
MILTLLLLLTCITVISTSPMIPVIEHVPFSHAHLSPIYDHSTHPDFALHSIVLDYFENKKSEFLHFN